jgi:hypothetical protein
MLYQGLRPILSCSHCSFCHSSVTQSACTKPPVSPEFLYQSMTCAQMDSV